MPNPVINEQLKSLLDDKTWHSYRVRLTAFAFKEIRERFWNGNDIGPLLGGMEPADYASGSLIDVLTETEPWDAVQYPNLLSHLFYVVEKRIRNALRRHETTQVFHVEDDDDFGSAKNLLSLEEEVEQENLIEGFFQFLDGDDELQLLIHCMKEGKLKRAHIASSLGLQPSDVTNLGKRLHRKSDEYLRHIHKSRKALG